MKQGSSGVRGASAGGERRPTHFTGNTVCVDKRAGREGRVYKTVLKPVLKSVQILQKRQWLEPEYRRIWVKHCRAELIRSHVALSGLHREL
jgi:hypothetical protein